MRGKPEPTVLGVVLIGITPACAGKTIPPQLQFPLVQDHPRVCGENLHFTHSKNPLRGSPPRVRGKRKIS